MTNLEELEQLCTALYTSPDATLRNQARQRLEGFENNPAYIQHCQLILNQSRLPVTHLMACSSMLKLLTDFWNNYSEDEIIVLRDYLLEYIAKQHADIKGYVMNKLVQVPCRITKLGWHTQSQRFRNIKDEIYKFFQSNVDHILIGLQLYSELVREINTLQKGTAITAHRRVAVSFRDDCLRAIFTSAFEILQNVHKGSFQYSDPTQESALVKASTNLLHACLTFDYIGTDPDEAVEEFFIIQMPGDWKMVMEDPNTSMILFQTLFSDKCTIDVKGKLLEVIVLMISVRRSIFTEESRLKFLSIFCQGCVTLLTENQELLQNEHCYTQICRLLVGIKNNYQLDDLTKIPCYQEWIFRASEFTILSFKSMKHTQGSVHFIIQLWARLCMAIPFLRNNLPVFLEEVISNIFEAFVDAQLERVGNACDEGLMEELYNKGDRDFQLRHLPYLARWKFKRSHDHVFQHLQPRIEAYKAAVNNLGPNISQEDFKQLQRLECELSWLFYVCGSMLAHIMGGTAGGNNENNKNEEIQLEASVCATIFQITPVVNARLEKATPNTPPTRYVDEALLFIFGQFRQNHIKAPAQSRMRPQRMYHKSQDDLLIYQALSNCLGSEVNQDVILTEIVSKVIVNLKCGYSHSKVVASSLHLLHHIATGFSSSQVLSNSDIAKEFLLSHGSTNFPFMTQVENLKQRTLFYEILTMILMQEDHIDLFDDFMRPFEVMFERLETVTDFSDPDVCIIGVGIARDLAGVLKALSSQRGYVAFFNWIYPRYFRIVLRMFEPWWNQTFVCVPMLKFIAAFTHQKFQRIEFPISSPNGIHLFREVSKVLVTYGNRVLQAPETNLDNPYKERYKAIKVCMTILFRALSAQYVNFGMFELYDDASLRNAILVVINLVRKFQYEVLMAYQKISLAWWKLLELLFRQHFEIVASDEQMFDYLFKSMYEGTQHKQPVQTSPVLHGIDHIFMWVHTNSLKKHPHALLPGISQYMKQNVEFVLKLFCSLLNNHLFGVQASTWAVCRPLYSIYLVFPEVWDAYLQRMIVHQSQGSQPLIAEKFKEVVANINLRSSNDRDTFIKQIIAFKSDVRDVLVKWET